MPTFDIVSEVDMHEASNAVDQANREIGTRFDFKGVNASFTLSESEVELEAEADFQIGQMLDILRNKLVKRGIDVSCLEEGEIETANLRAKQKVTIRQGLDSLLTKKIVKVIKEKKMKVQAAIQGDKVRVTGKKRDDLQTVIGMLKEAEFDIPLQFNNFRD